MKLPPILTPDGRRAWAFGAILGACIVMTCFAAVAVYLVSGNALYSFLLGLAAHFQILVGTTAFGWALGRRMSLEANKDGAKISDGGSQDV
jgi:hypothetical protein